MQEVCSVDTPMMLYWSLRRLKYFSPFLPTVTSFTSTPSALNSLLLFSAYTEKRICDENLYTDQLAQGLKKS